jgi:hypothetical protein
MICCWTTTPAQQAPLICSSTRHATVLKKAHLTVVIALSTAPLSPSRLRSDGRHLHHTQAAACLPPSPLRLLPAATTRLSRLPALLPGRMRRSARRSRPRLHAYGCIAVSSEEDRHEAMSRSAHTSRPMTLHGAGRHLVHHAHRLRGVVCGWTCPCPGWAVAVWSTTADQATSAIDPC